MTANERFNSTGAGGSTAPSDVPLPAHYELTRAQLLFSGASIAAAFLVLGVFAFRLATRMDLWHWWVPVAFVAGMAAADFGSGLIHWGADTWGRDDLPVIGHRLLVPFRVHHINPDDFLRRRFVTTNGDVAFLMVPVVLGLFAVPLESPWGGAFAVWGFGLCGVGMMTNQIHQWAHMPSPPRVVRLLQDCGLILGREEHAVHHARPYDAQYCITTGWCNGPIESLGIFRGLESAITTLTGARPRHDDERYEERYGVVARQDTARRG